MTQNAAVILLSEVRALRERASRARDVARGMYRREVIELLEQFAREFEQRAKELEAEVHRLGREAAARTGQIAAELSGTVGKAAAEVAGIQPRIASIGDDSDG